MNRYVTQFQAELCLWADLNSMVMCENKKKSGLVPKILKDSKCKKKRTVEQIFLSEPVLAQSF